MDDRDDLMQMTVRALRDLARKVVGAGYSRLRTRAELIAAIVKERRGKEVAPRTPAARRAAPAPPPGPQAGAPKGEGAGDEHAWESGQGSPSQAAEPRPEGLMVARVVGASEVHSAPHALTEDRLHEPPPPPSPADLEGLGELPWSYGDDALVALPRDPRTLWVYWDLRPETVRAAIEGLEDPRARLRIHAGNELVREIDFALESRSFYINDLPPGRPYRVEIVFVGRNGERAVRSPSNTVGLPPIGPSAIIDDRFVTLPWGMPLRRDLFERGTSEAEISERQRELIFEASGGGRPLGASERAQEEWTWRRRQGGGAMSGRPTSSPPEEK